jgi:hypothetical protein
LAARAPGVLWGQEDIDLRRDQLGGESGKAIVISLGKLIVDGNIFSLLVAELAQAL